MIFSRLFGDSTSSNPSARSVRISFLLVSKHYNLDVRLPSTVWYLTLAVYLCYVFIHMHHGYALLQGSCLLWSRGGL